MHLYRRCLKLKKFEVEEIWSWLNLKLKKFEVEEIWSWRILNLKTFEVEESWSWRNLKLKEFEVEEIWSIRFDNRKSLTKFKILKKSWGLKTGFETVKPSFRWLPSFVRIIKVFK